MKKSYFLLSTLTVSFLMGCQKEPAMPTVLEQPLPTVVPEAEPVLPEIMPTPEEEPEPKGPEKTSSFWGKFGKCMAGGAVGLVAGVPIAQEAGIGIRKLAKQDIYTEFKDNNIQYQTNWWGKATQKTDPSNVLGHLILGVGISNTDGDGHPLSLLQKIQSFGKGMLGSSSLTLSQQPWELLGVLGMGVAGCVGANYIR